MGYNILFDQAKFPTPYKELSQDPKHLKVRKCSDGQAAESIKDVLKKKVQLGLLTSI